MTIRFDDPIGPNGETREWLILASIRAGGYPQVAAEAYGVTPKQYRKTLERKGREAAARARLKAEMKVFDADPRSWLKHGPGKETRQSPGWSTTSKQFDGGGSAGDLLASSDFHGILRELLNGLNAYPDARVAAAAAVSRIRNRPDDN